jgi:hypothetical protein
MGGVGTKWLDICSLCRSYLPSIGGSAQVERIYYFSALAQHLKAVDPGKISRHRAFIQCLESTGIVVELGRFKPKEIWCNLCKKLLIRHEEKETDVAISVRLLEVFIKDECDTAVLVTGDTDLAPAVRTARRLFPAKSICFLFPYKRKNRELDRLADRSFRIGRRSYARHQFPDLVQISRGRELRKPRGW